MNWPTGGATDFLAFLLPGFVSVAIFYLLTSHRKPNAFDKVVQALIFTALAQAMTWVVVALFQPHAENGVDWTESYRLPVSVAIAAVLGLAAARVANRDILHRFFRRCGFTVETSYPSEWYSSFIRHRNCYVILHLDDERRLRGYAEEWPSLPDEGHFRISEAEWLTEETVIEATEGVAFILVPADHVKMVEFLNELPHDASNQRDEE